MKFISFIDDHNNYLVWAFIVLSEGRSEFINVNYFSSYDLYNLSPYEIYFQFTKDQQALKRHPL